MAIRSLVAALLLSRVVAAEPNKPALTACESKCGHKPAATRN
jgi:hypothetical protein